MRVDVSRTEKVTELLFRIENEQEQIDLKKVLDVFMEVSQPNIGIISGKSTKKGIRTLKLRVLK